MNSEFAKIRWNDFDELLVDPDFTAAEQLVNRFNLFTAVGIARQEIRHSRFLATILDPGGSHGLRDRFLKVFLQQVCKSVNSELISTTDVLLRDWDDLRVRREWRNIDLLLFSESASFVCVIENKILSGEHGDQLARYRTQVDREFPANRFTRRIFLYLSPDGTAPTDGAYSPMSYLQILEAVDKLLKSEKHRADPDVLVVVRHYADLLRSAIVKHEELEEVCRRLYHRHRAVIDAINEFGTPDEAKAITGHLKTLVKNSAKDGSLALDHSTLSIVRFADMELDGRPWMKESTGWTSSGRILLYEFTRKSNSLLLELVVGAGSDTVRRKIIDGCQGEPFRSWKKVTQWHRVWADCVLDENDFESYRSGEKSFDDLMRTVDSFWAKFTASTLKKLRARLLEI